MPEVLLVGCGAALGAASRFLLSGLIGGALLPLLLINVAGSALMGYLKPGPLWGTGFFGGFTSFATFAYLTSQATPAVAISYACATILGCVGGYLLGDRLR